MTQSELQHLLASGFNVLTSKDNITFTPEKWGQSEFSSLGLNSDFETIIHLKTLDECPAFREKIVLLPGLM